jgi:N-acetyl-gamma-glutamylphosphate reductase
MSIRVGIVGISGYGGGEAMRLVAGRLDAARRFYAGRASSAATSTQRKGLRAQSRSHRAYQPVSRPNLISTEDGFPRIGFLR